SRIQPDTHTRHTNGDTRHRARPISPSEQHAISSSCRPGAAYELGQYQAQPDVAGRNIIVHERSRKTVARDAPEIREEKNRGVDKWHRGKRRDLTVTGRFPDQYRNLKQQPGKNKLHPWEWKAARMHTIIAIYADQKRNRQQQTVGL